MRLSAHSATGLEREERGVGVQGEDE